MPKRKSDPAFRGGVTDGDTVTVPIQKKEGDTELVSSVRASELTLDRGDVAESAAIEFKVKRTDVPKGRKQIQLTHALVNDTDGTRRETLSTSFWTTDVGDHKAVRLWLVGFGNRGDSHLDGTEVRDWRKGCKVPVDLRAAFQLMRDVENLKTVAGRYVIDSPYAPLLRQGAHMWKCVVRNWEDQLHFDHGGWSHDEAWNNARDQVIANGATGLNDMEDARFFAWLPDNHKENARNSLLHRWIGWDGVETTNDRLVPLGVEFHIAFTKTTSSTTTPARWRE